LNERVGKAAGERGLGRSTQARVGQDLLNTEEGVLAFLDGGRLSATPSRETSTAPALMAVTESATPR